MLKTTFSAFQYFWNTEEGRVTLVLVFFLMWSNMEFESKTEFAEIVFSVWTLGQLKKAIRNWSATVAIANNSPSFGSRRLQHFAQIVAINNNNNKHVIPLVLLSLWDTSINVVVKEDGAALEVITLCWGTGEQFAGCRVSKRYRWALEDDDTDDIQLPLRTKPCELGAMAAGPVLWTWIPIQLAVLVLWTAGRVSKVSLNRCVE